jgi:hypothetical protein
VLDFEQLEEDVERGVIDRYIAAHSPDFIPKAHSDDLLRGSCRS